MPQFDKLSYSTQIFSLPVIPAFFYIRKSNISKSSNTPLEIKFKTGHIKINSNIIQKLKKICIYIDNKFSNILSKYIKDNHLLKLVKILIYSDIFIIFFFNVLIYILNEYPFTVLIFMLDLERGIIDNILNGPLYGAMIYSTTIKYILYSKLAATIFLIKFYSQKNEALIKIIGCASIDKFSEFLVQYVKHNHLLRLVKVLLYIDIVVIILLIYWFTLPLILLPYYFISDWFK